VDTRESIEAVAELHRRAANGDIVSRDEWSAAAAAARSAAASAQKDKMIEMITASS
jgi:hypothetical protein